ncbi:MAG: hypothetical protein AAGB93_10305 [Planctomycetota bacterium]
MKTSTKTGLWIVLLSVVAIGIVGGLEERDERGDTPGKERLSLGDTWTWQPSAPDRIGARSVKGYHRIASATAVFRGEDGSEAAFEARGTAQRLEPARITLEPTTTTEELLEEPIAPSVAIDVPASADLEGRVGVLRVAGWIVHPGIVVDDATETFDLEPNTTAFFEEVEVALVAAPKRSIDGEDDELGLVPALVVILFLLGLALFTWGIVGTRILATSALLIAVPLTILVSTDTRPRARDRVVAAGSPLSLDLEVGAASVKGYHRATSLSAWIRGVEDDQIEVPARAAGDVPWPNTIKVESVRVGAAFKTNRESIDTTVEVDLPPIERVGGRSGTLVIAGVVDHPDVGALDALNPLLSEFGIASKRFVETRELVFAAEGQDVPEEPEDPGGPPVWLVLPMGAGCWLLVWGFARPLIRRWRG